MIWPDRERVRASANRILAHLWEIRLFWDEPSLVLRAQRDLLVENGRLLKLLAVPLLLSSLPMLIVFALWHRPLHSQEKVIVLGVDGMDPAFVERHWDALPNLRALRDSGYFGRLRTTNPPQSPVAWSTFATGLDPDQHGIYDFVERDAATGGLFSSMGRTYRTRFSLPIGPYLLPLLHTEVKNLRQGTPFWRTLVEHGVPAMVQRMPVNYPPEKSGSGLAGMGTPDLLGTQGTFTFFTDEPSEVAREVSGGRIVKAQVSQGHAELRLEGPFNPLRMDRAMTASMMKVDVDPAKDVARVTLGDGPAVLIKQGEWSGWLSTKLVLIPHVSSVRAMVRVFAKQLHPGFELYVSPMNVDPAQPAFLISYPASWSAVAAQEIGPFFTLGIPQDTSALRQEVLTHAQFRQQAELVFREEKKLLEYSLRQFNGGFLFFYFSSIDQNSHILWGKYEEELLKVYQEVDECVGEVRRAEPAAKLMVISDHGFTTFERAVNLNTWLRQNGWGEAHAEGLNGLYAERTEPLRQQLLEWRDVERGGQKVIESVTETHPTEANRAMAPQLIVGYAAGYRASWQTGLGETPLTLIDDNNDAWIGDHCVDPNIVPGVLFSNEKIELRDARLQDVTAAILRRFGLAAPSGYNGHSF